MVTPPPFRLDICERMTWIQFIGTHICKLRYSYFRKMASHSHMVPTKCEGADNNRSHMSTKPIVKYINEQSLRLKPVQKRLIEVRTIGSIIVFYMFNSLSRIPSAT